MATSAIAGSATATVCKSVVVNKTTNVETATSIWLGKRSELVTGPDGLRTGGADGFCANRVLFAADGPSPMAPWLLSRAAARARSANRIFRVYRRAPPPNASRSAGAPTTAASVRPGTSITFFMPPTAACALAGVGANSMILPPPAERNLRLRGDERFAPFASLAGALTLIVSGGTGARKLFGRGGHQFGARRRAAYGVRRPGRAARQRARSPKVRRAENRLTTKASGARLFRRAPGACATVAPALRQSQRIGGDERS